MKKILLSTILVFTSLTPANGQIGSTNSVTRFFVAFGFEKITVTTASIGFTTATIQPAGAAYRAEKAEMSVEGCPIRYKTNSSGTALSATTGILMQVGSSAIYGWDNINAVRFWRDTSCSADATINVQYYR